MNTRPIARAVALGLAFVVTLGLLGGIDHLAQPEEAAPQWAQYLTHRA